MRALHHSHIATHSRSASAAMRGRTSPYLDRADALGLMFTEYDLLDAGVSLETVARVFRDEHVVDRPVNEVAPSSFGTMRLLRRLDRALDEIADLRDAVRALVDGVDAPGVLQTDHESSSCDARSRCNAPVQHVTVEGPTDVSPVPSVIDVAVDGYAWRAALARDVERETRR